MGGREGKELPLLFALNGVKGHFGKCFVTFFISSLVKKRKRGRGGKVGKGKRKCEVKSVPSRLFERWVETGGGEVAVGERDKFYGIVSSEKPLVLGRGAGRLGRGWGCYAPLF